MMSKNILIGIGLLAVLACGLTLTVTQGLWQDLTDSVRVNNLAQGIAEFDLPADYQADYAVEMLGYTIVAYQSADAQSHLAFLQAPPGIIPDGQVLEGYVAHDRATTTWDDATVLRTEERTIRDQPAMMTLSDRRNGEGQHYRSLNLVFEGRAGTVLLTINQPVAQWDNDTIEAFVASIH